MNNAANRNINAPMTSRYWIKSESFTPYFNIARSRLASVAGRAALAIGST
jgi:hypothetical protein